MTKQTAIIAKVQVSALTQLGQLNIKFAKLRALRNEINKLKVLYAEHDALMQELLPLFIKIEPDKFTIHREITLGTEKFRLTPYFYDPKKGTILAKVWKSAAHEMGTIE